MDLERVYYNLAKTEKEYKRRREVNILKNSRTPVKNAVLVELYKKKKERP